jgi:hypothetical protein
VTDPAGGFGQQRMMGLFDQHGVANQCTHPHAAVDGGDGGQPGDAVDVDQQARASHAQREHRHQALAAGKDLAVAIDVGQRANGFIHAADPDVVKPCWLHGSAP